MSQYNYLNRRPDLCEKLSLGPQRTFDAYLERIAAVDHVQWTPQAAFVLDAAGEPLVEVFRLEDLSRDFTPLSRKLGIRSRWGHRLGRPLRVMPHSNRQERHGADRADCVIGRSTVTETQVSRVYELFKDDYSLLGYARA